MSRCFPEYRYTIQTHLENMHKEQQLCDYLYICHAVGTVKKIAGEQDDVPREIYKVSRVVRVTLEMPAGFMHVHMHAPYTVSLLRMFVEMEAPLGGAKREHFTLEVLPQLLQKGERLAVQEPARDPQMSVDERLYRAKVHRWRETRQSPDHLIISLHAYYICLAFESITKMDQWHSAMERVLGTYACSGVCIAVVGCKSCTLLETRKLLHIFPMQIVARYCFT